MHREYPLGMTFFLFCLRQKRDKCAFWLLSLHLYISQQKFRINCVAAQLFDHSAVPESPVRITTCFTTWGINTVSSLALVQSFEKTIFSYEQDVQSHFLNAFSTRTELSNNPEGLINLGRRGGIDSASKCQVERKSEKGSVHSCHCFWLPQSVSDGG